MRIKAFMLIVILLMLATAVPSVFPIDGRLPNELSVFNGKWFKGSEDSEFKNYDFALRDTLVKRIRKQFGLELDPNAYSGFDLLELEAFIRCKKSKEPIDHFLKILQKAP